tara:strand:+ start:5477 stop:6193 length:717 start_codon:yes stop_codon:yes gene_type:complete
VDAVLLDQNRPTVVDLENPVFLDSGNRIDELGYYAVLLWEYRVKYTMEVGEVEVPTLLRPKEGGGWEYLVLLPKPDERSYKDINELTVVVKKPNEWTMDPSRQVNNPKQRHAFSVREAIEDMEMHEGVLVLSNEPDEQEYYYTQELLKKVGLVMSLLLTLSPEQLREHWGWGLELSLMLIPYFDDEEETESSALALIKDKQKDYLAQLKYRRDRELTTLENKRRRANPPEVLDDKLYN